MPSYFGHQNGASGFDSGNADTCVANRNLVFTCPGSGSQIVKELSSYCKSGGGTPGYIRIGLHTTGLSKICEGSAAALIDSTSEDWYGHLTQASISPNPVTITGGVDYILALAFLGNDVNTRWDSPGTANDFCRPDPESGLVSGGFPSSWTWGFSTTHHWDVRCGVDPAPAASIDQEGFRFRNDDNDEANASWKAAQDTGITAPTGSNARLRKIINATGDPAANNYQLEWMKSGDAQWTPLQ